MTFLRVTLGCASALTPDWLLRCISEVSGLKFQTETLPERASPFIGATRRIRTDDLPITNQFEGKIAA